MIVAAANPPRNGEGDRAKRGGGGSPPLRRPAIYAARKLRRTMTPPEALLWQKLRTRRGGYKFRRQHPIDPYTVDFFCREAGLVVEVDGWAHDTSERAARDVRRDAFLRDKGLAILRISAAEIMRDPVGAIQSILAWAGNPLHQPPAGPPPRSGEDI